MDVISKPAHQNLSEQSKTNPTARRKKNQQQVKVVHFSNPLMITTTAADFRALVQELTGRDSVIADFLAGHPPSAAGYPCDGCNRLDLLAGSELDRTGIFDLPGTDFEVESGGYCGGGNFEIYGERFGRVEDFGVVLTESVAQETPVIAGDGVYGWIL